MGASSVAVKRGFKHTTNEERNIDNPYAHLAVAIIIQAWSDLTNLENADSAVIDSGTVRKWEVVKFFRSKWCEALLSCQEAVTFAQLSAAVEERLKV